MNLLNMEQENFKKCDEYKVIHVIPIDRELPMESSSYTVEILKRGDGFKSWYTKMLYYNTSNNNWSDLEDGEVITHWYKEID